MSPNAYKTAVGAFVVGGAALFILGLILLGGKSFFNDSLEYVLYFDGSVSGLSIGAPVVFRGVPMGNVTQISLVANARDNNITIPVTIRIDDRSFIRTNGETISEAAQAQILERMIEKGLRARLQLASLITGQYRVELDFFPNTPLHFRSSNPNSEIPTIPSPIDTLQRTLARLPIDQIADSLTSILSSLTEAVGDGKLKEGIEAFTGAFQDMQKILQEGAIRDAIKNVLDQLGDASHAVAVGLPHSMESFDAMLGSITRAANELRKLVNSADQTIGSDSQTMNDLRRLLREGSAAARSLRNFADMLERNPEALLKGRQGKR